MSFSGAFKRFRVKSMDKFVRVKRSASFELYSAIVTTTPVDKGVLINNWYLTVDDPSTSTRFAESETGAHSLSQGTAILPAFNIANDVWITNNLPYAYPIEFDGHSAKAPSGMVRVNTVNWNDFVKRASQRESYNG
ncbi:tail component [Alteromonas phage vB_AcoS-R7M]|uniref:Tail component n=1 Tax=Alteromonas phage vB_AcoS-R7M TaxID=2729541 RepID=A0A6M3YN63_9CAUD|nr:tail completion or Neck1 protein [Alteromonas phage vB_AcoS-R7M]QJI53353.1 tail component [Alteromonas phage vB_AcoS-R7M]